MKRRVNHSAMSASGYASPWSASAGGRTALHLSSDAQLRQVQLKRIDLPKPELVDWPVLPLEPVSHRNFELGSYLSISGDATTADARQPGFEVRALRFELFLTVNDGERTVLDASPVRLVLNGRRLELRVDGVASHVIEGVPLRCWLDVALVHDEANISLSVRSHDILVPFHVEAAVRASFGWYVARLLLGHCAEDNAASLNARFSRIELETPDASHSWRFPTLLNLEPLSSGQTAPLFLSAVNLPTFCVTSPRWDGSSLDPRVAPDHYDAVHCHDDDMGAVDWPISFEADIPGDASSGVYAWEVETDSGREEVAFFISASRSAAGILFLVPTATYLAYANEVLPPHLYQWQGDDRGHRFAVANELRSLYDYHNDRSGVSITSWRKPKVTLRDDYSYPLCGCAHNLPVDLRLLRFCHEHDIAFDLITDHDLHERGVAALAGYRTLMTGSHPEYMSVGMEQAIREFAASGGNIAYLGGNGFAATVAFRDDLMELRRSPLEAGRTWDGPVSEQTLALTNEPGGFLRSRGRGEFSLVGVAISLMGFDGARPFTRTSDSHQAKFAWIFDGVDAETFGSDGTVLGGAAGYEVDATDPHLGTPEDTVVLARAEGFSDAFFHDPSRWYAGGEEEAASRRCAEMTIRCLPDGNWIYSASSVAWCGALPDTGQMNDVGRITLNLLQGQKGSA